MNYSDPFGLKSCGVDAFSESCSADELSSSLPQGVQGGPTPEPSPFGEPALAPYEKRREIHYGGMVINTRGDKPAGDYKWTVSIAGTAGKKGTLTLQLRKTKAASFGRTEYIYSGELEMGGKSYEATANLYTLGSKVFYGYIDVKPF